ncbi:hypothetical protein U9J35_09795 [Rossellomorea aquimaris]|nr:hypothetical protein [Rossellomorea aquimaris]WRP08429.1 hypothetical protein U9J35_09795 [Rossellomorea aquimaris]
MSHIHGINSNQPLDQKPFSIQSGKVLSISVHKLLGEGNAVVSAHGQRFIAKIEAPMEAGGRYWVEVKQSESNVSLHLIPSRGQTGVEYGKHAAANLLQHFSISTSGKEMNEFVMELMKKNIPIHKELLLFGEKRLKGKDSSENVKTLVEMAKRNMPLSDRVFLSMRAGTSTGSILSMLNELASKLRGTGRDTATLHLLTGIQKPLNRLASEKLVINALSSLVDSSQTFSNRLGHFDLLKSLGVFPKETPMNHWRKGLKTTLLEELKQSSHGQWERKIDFLRTQLANHPGPAPLKLQNDLNQLLSTTTGRGPEFPKLSGTHIDKWINIILSSETVLNGERDEPSFVAAKELMGVIGEGKWRSIEMNYMRHLQSYGKGAPVSNMERLFQKLHLQIEQELTQAIRGEEMARVLKKVIGTFGINFEAQLQKNGQELQNHPTIKQHLIGLSQNHPLADIRMLADDLVLKMNHQVLQSLESSPFLTIVQQFPFSLYGESTDITLQWTGKEKEKGVIDGDYCRVLFYLELDIMKETLIDMQVQNRVVSLTVWNDHPNAERMSRSFIPGLKEGLEKLDYQLTMVKVKAPDKQVELSDKIIAERFKTFSGVDLKI